jgi:hypothetical protein
LERVAGDGGVEREIGGEREVGEDWEEPHLYLPLLLLLLLLPLPQCLRES